MSESYSLEDYKEITQLIDRVRRDRKDIVVFEALVSKLKHIIPKTRRKSTCALGCLEIVVYFVFAVFFGVSLWFSSLLECRVLRVTSVLSFFFFDGLALSCLVFVLSSLVFIGLCSVLCFL